jgi:hypothetical protein
MYSMLYAVLYHAGYVVSHLVRHHTQARARCLAHRKGVHSDVPAYRVVTEFVGFYAKF